MGFCCEHMLSCECVFVCEREYGMETEKEAG